MLRLFRTLRLRAPAGNPFRLLARGHLRVEELETRALLSGSAWMSSAAPPLSEATLGQPPSAVPPAPTISAPDLVTALASAPGGGTAGTVPNPVPVVPSSPYPGLTGTRIVAIQALESGISINHFLWAQPANLPVQVADPLGDSLASRLKRALGGAPFQGTTPVFANGTLKDVADRDRRSPDRSTAGQNPSLESGNGRSTPSGVSASSTGATSQPGSVAPGPMESRPEALPSGPPEGVKDRNGAASTGLRTSPTVTLQGPALAPEIQAEAKLVAQTGPARSRFSSETLGDVGDFQLIAAVAAPSQPPLAIAWMATSAAAGPPTTASAQPLPVADLIRMVGGVLPSGSIVPVAHTFSREETPASRWASGLLESSKRNGGSRQTTSGSVGLREGASQADAELAPAELIPALSVTGVEVPPLGALPHPASTDSLSGAGRNLAPMVRDRSLLRDPDTDLALARDLLIAGAVVSLFVGSLWGAPSERSQLPNGRLLRTKKHKSSP